MLQQNVKLAIYPNRQETSIELSMNVSIKFLMIHEYNFFLTYVGRISNNY